jgi:hypothetical protein
MSLSPNTYCLDANVLIQAWQKYYSPKFCPDYWKILNELGRQGRIFLAEEIHQEIVRTEDELTGWLETSEIPINKTDGNVIACWRKILDSNPLHKLLVDDVKGRSLGDPWLIAHAMNAKAIVVTKEVLLTAANSTKIRIPNVCDNMGVPWMDDFGFVRDLGIQFMCSLEDGQS